METFGLLEKTVQKFKVDSKAILSKAALCDFSKSKLRTFSPQQGEPCSSRNYCDINTTAVGAVVKQVQRRQRTTRSRNTVVTAHSPFNSVQKTLADKSIQKVHGVNVNGKHSRIVVIILGWCTQPGHPSV